MYVTVSVGITESQLQTLLAGQKIFLEKSQFKGDVALPLTKAQATLVATASRSINLKLSSRQIKEIQSGEGWLSDRFKQLRDAVKPAIKAALPLARKAVDQGLDLLQAKIPTQQAGPFKGMADKAVIAGRKQVNSWVDRLQKMLGGAAGIKAIEAQLGDGWFSDYLLPSVETAAKIATPFVKGGGSRKDYEPAIDKEMGEGWFSNYLLPGVETAAKIATPFIKGQGWFKDYLLPSVETGAKIATPFLKGGQFVPGHYANRRPALSLGEGFFSSFLGPALRIGAPLAIKALGGGWTPMAEMKKHSGAGLVL